MSTAERVDTVIIGGGQGGLVTAYELRKRGREAVILDAHQRVGDAWRTRWDSLQLFTPRRDCRLPGLRMTGDQNRMPTKDEMADYLEQYAVHNSLLVRNRVEVLRLSHDGDAFLIETTAGDLAASSVVVAAGSYRRGKTPAFAADLDPHIVQVHSGDYRNASQLQPGGVLLVGGANSGCDIAMDVIKTHDTWLAGPKVKNIPVDIDGWLGRMIVARVVRFMLRNVMSLGTPIGRKRAPRLRDETTPVIRVKPAWMQKAGVHRVGRVVGVEDGLPKLDDGQVLDITNVIWCTGFHHDFPWIDLPLYDEDGYVQHVRGVSMNVDGLYFVGLPFQYSVASIGLWGMDRDAAFIAEQLVRRHPRLDAGWPLARDVSGPDGSVPPAQSGLAARVGVPARHR